MEQQQRRATHTPILSIYNKIPTYTGRRIYFVVKLPQNFVLHRKNRKVKKNGTKKSWICFTSSPWLRLWFIRELTSGLENIDTHKRKIRIHHHQLHVDADDDHNHCHCEGTINQCKAKEAETMETKKGRREWLICSSHSSSVGLLILCVYIVEMILQQWMEGMKWWDR